MSRRWPALLAPFCVIALTAAPGAAQEVYGPTDSTSDADDGEPVPLVEPEPCEEEVREDGVIVVCRELPETERYMSPLPKPVQSDRRIVPGLTDPPCWVTGAPNCFRFGSVPPYPPLVDTSAFPEPLSADEAAAVSALAPDGDSAADARLGERVPIDLSEED